MFRILRNKKTQKKIWIFLCIVILPPFIFWGASSVLDDKKQTKPSQKIFGKSVSETEFDESLQAVKNQAIIQFGDMFPEMKKMLNLEVQAMERIILLREAKQKKFQVSDKEVVDFIQNFPLFQNKGKFSQQSYSYMVQYVFRTQSRVYEEQTRQNLIIEKLFNTITKDAKVSEEEIKEAYKKENEQISVYYIAGLFADFEKNVTASDIELKDYYAKNSLSFKQPLSFNLEYLGLITETKTNEIAARLNKKEDLDKILKDESLSLKETGLFTQEDSIPGVGWSKEISEILPSLKLGQVSGPILVDKTYYFIRLKDRKETYIPDFEKIKEKVKEAVIIEKTKSLTKEKIEKCENMLKEMTKNNPKAVDFDKTAKDTGLKSAATDLFKSGSYIEGIGASDDFYAIAGELKDDQFSKIIETATGYYIIRMKLRVTMDENKFKTEKDTFRSKLVDQKKQEIFGKFYEELKKRALGSSK